MTTWTIGKKLLISFGATIALTVALAIAALQINGSLQGELDRAVKVTAKRQLLAGKLSATAENMVALDRGIAFSLVLQQLEKAQNLRREFDQASQGLRRDLSDIHSIADNVGKEDLRELDTLYGSVDAGQREFMQQLSGQQLDVALKTFDEQVAPRIRKLSEKARTLVETRRKTARRGQCSFGSAGRPGKVADDGTLSAVPASRCRGAGNRPANHRYASRSNGRNHRLRDASSGSRRADRIFQQLHVGSRDAAGEFARRDLGLQSGNEFSDSEERGSVAARGLGDGGSRRHGFGKRM